MCRARQADDATRAAGELPVLHGENVVTPAHKSGPSREVRAVGSDHEVLGHDILSSSRRR